MSEPATLGLAVAFLPSIQDLAGGCSNLLRDVLELAQTHAGTPVLADVVGLSAASDVAIARRFW